MEDREFYRSEAPMQGDASVLEKNFLILPSMDFDILRKGKSKSVPCSYMS